MSELTEEKWEAHSAAVDAATARGDNEVDPEEEAEVFADVAKLAQREHPPTPQHVVGGPCLLCGGELRLTPPRDRLLWRWQLVCVPPGPLVYDETKPPAGCGVRHHGPRDLVAWLETAAGYAEARRMATAASVAWRDERELAAELAAPLGMPEAT